MTDPNRYEDTLIDAAAHVAERGATPQFVHFTDLDGNYRVAHAGDPDACEALWAKLGKTLGISK